MGALRKILVGCALTFPLPALAEDDLLRFFATCAGRFSAEMEHQWLLQAPSDDMIAARAATTEILDTLLSPDRGRDVLAWRIEAKHAQATLLSRATFNDDVDDARWAAERAKTELAHCRALILAGTPSDNGA